MLTPLDAIRAAKKQTAKTRRVVTRRILAEFNKVANFRLPLTPADTTSLPFDSDNQYRKQNDADFESELNEIIESVKFPDRHVGKKKRNDIHSSNDILAAFLRSQVKQSELRRGKLYSKTQEQSLPDYTKKKPCSSCF